MPVYDYECTDCGAFETVRHIAERDDPAECPRCGEIAGRVTVGAPSFGKAQVVLPVYLLRARAPAVTA